jgi:ribonucleoside-triphosphate reductase
MGVIVQTSQETCEVFRKRKIVDSLEKETSVREAEAMKIARSVERQVKKIKGETITTSQIREMVNEKLIERGKVDEARQHQRVGIPSAEIKSLIRGHNTDNANLQRNPETFHKFVADAALKQYALSCLPNELAKAHDRGDIHIHDLEYFPARPINCLQHDLRWFIKDGFKPDGSGEHTSVAGPPKRITTLVNHMGEILLAGQQNCSGGQGMSLWNVFVAPFINKNSPEIITEAMQMLVFNLNMAYSNRGGQVPFTSLNTEFTVPRFLENEPAYGPGGKVVGVYGDYEEEVRLINKAFTEILIKGDYVGKPHLFPNAIWMLRKEMMTDDLEEDFYRVHNLSSKYSTPYFANCLPAYAGGHSNVMGCRTRLNTTWTGEWDTDTLRTGNLAYISLNLPRLGYREDGTFYEGLDNILGLGEELLLLRRQHALKCLGRFNLLPFLSHENSEGDQYYRIENSTLSFGIVGMDETLRALGIEDGIVSTEGQREANSILDYINAYVNDLVDETGYRWTVLQSPAETTAHRFATLDKKHYPDKVIPKGEDGALYYTNSTHIPVDNKSLITKKIKIESQFHPKTAGGHIFHGFIGDSTPEPGALMSLTSKVAKKSDLGFWAYTGAFSYCFKCNTLMKGLQDTCGSCGHSDKLEHYSRITGYLQQVGNRKDSAGGWNAGKKKELEDRFGGLI